MLEIFKLTFNDKIDKPTHPEIETDVSDCPCIFTATWLSLNLPRQPERFPQPSALSLLQIETSVEVKQRFPAAWQNDHSAICRVETITLHPFTPLLLHPIKTLQNTLETPTPQSTAATPEPVLGL